jgi:hypothetical protein
MDFGKEAMFPPLPLAEWKDTKDTLHLYLQIVGKVRLALSPRVNHWWHVTFQVAPRGLSTGAIPYRYGAFAIDFDFVDHALSVTTSAGGRRQLPLADGLSVSRFYRAFRADLSALGIDVGIRPVPYDTFSVEPFETDTRHASYDREYIDRFRRIHVAVDGIFQEFRGRFTGKSTPVHVFWHSFDLALTRFSGRRAPEPEGLAREPLRPAAACWSPAGAGVMAVLTYDDVRTASSPRDAVLEFLESAYQAGAKRAGWDRESFELRPPS